MRAQARARTIRVPKGETMKVKDVMTLNGAMVGPDASLKEVAAILTDLRISGLPVVDEDARVLGVVSEGDIVHKEADGRPGRTAGEAMTSPALTIEADWTIANAARLMDEKAVNRLPVLAGGKLVGIVSRADLVRAFLRYDEQIAQEIRTDVVLGTFAIAPENLRIEVANGEVTLGGEVETADLAELLPAFVERVPGVVAVDSHLTWRGRGRLTERAY
jgi:CBS domain-containing protein